MSATLTVTDAALLAFAEEVGNTDPIAIEGGRTRWDLGGAPTGQPRLIRAPEGIVNYQPEEMTVQVRAGTSVAELHAALAEKGQRTSLPERGGTVGGALAVGENDFRALGRGRIRESLLQVRYVSADGKIVSSGGPTVKNVSGFDLPRLMVGSLGSLGCLAEVILRTNPIPAESRWLRAEAVDAQVVFDSLLHPSAVLTDGTDVWVELEGHGPDVDQQAQVLAGLASFTDAEAPDFPAQRWSMRPSDAVNFEPADGERFIATVGLGLVFTDSPAPQSEVDPASAVIADRLKSNFDPTGRLNPGRMPGRN